MSRLSRLLLLLVHEQRTRRGPRKVRRGPLRDESYKAFIRRQVCCCGCGRGPCDAAHTGPHGLGQKAGDETCIPLWWECHSEMHRIGQAEFEKRRGICIAYIVEGFHTEWSAR